MKGEMGKRALLVTVLLHGPGFLEAWYGSLQKREEIRGVSRERPTAGQRYSMGVDVAVESMGGGLNQPWDRILNQDRRPARPISAAPYCELPDKLKGG